MKGLNNLSLEESFSFILDRQFYFIHTATIFCKKKDGSSEKTVIDVTAFLTMISTNNFYCDESIGFENKHIIDFLSIIVSIDNEIKDYLKNKFKIEDGLKPSDIEKKFIKVKNNFTIKDEKLIESIHTSDNKLIFETLTTSFIYRNFARLAFDLNNKFLALKMYSSSEISYGQAMQLGKIDIENIVQQSILNHSIKIGQKGGIKKGENLKPIRQEILEYHDKRFAEKKPNGKFLHSNAETARLIIKQLKIDCYEENSLSNIIRQHRKSNFTP